MKKLGFGLDCSSPSELVLARKNGFRGEDIMFSSNNTTEDIFEMAVADGGCILNIDDITMIDKVKEFPELICFRYNPGERRTGNELIGIPVEAKYGLRHDQVIPAYRAAIKRGARRFGLHSMIISNERNYHYMVETVHMLLDVIEMVSKELNIKFEFFNISGGIGIPYRPEDTIFDMPSFVQRNKSTAAKVRAKKRLYSKIVYGMRPFYHRASRCAGGDRNQQDEQIPRICRCEHFNDVRQPQTGDI